MSAFGLRVNARTILAERFNERWCVLLGLSECANLSGCWRPWGAEKGGEGRSLAADEGLGGSAAQGFDDRQGTRGRDGRSARRAKRRSLSPRSLVAGLGGVVPFPGDAADEAVARDGGASFLTEVRDFLAARGVPRLRVGGVGAGGGEGIGDRFDGLVRGCGRKAVEAAAAAEAAGGHHAVED